jgi:hypothetical protein
MILATEQRKLRADVTELGYNCVSKGPCAIIERFQASPTDLMEVAAGYKHSLPVKPFISGNDGSARREYSMLHNKMDM